MANTPEMVRSIFRSRGVSFRAWATAKGFKYASVIQVLRGKARGDYGESHRIAVALGLKEGTTSAADFDPTAPTDSSEAA